MAKKVIKAFKDVKKNDIVKTKAGKGKIVKKMKSLTDKNPKYESLSASLDILHLLQKGNQTIPDGFVVVEFEDGSQTAFMYDMKSTKVEDVAIIKESRGITHVVVTENIAWGDWDDEDNDDYDRDDFDVDFDDEDFEDEDFADDRISRIADLDDEEFGDDFKNEYEDESEDDGFDEYGFGETPDESDFEDDFDEHGLGQPARKRRR